MKQYIPTIILSIISLSFGYYVYAQEVLPKPEIIDKPLIEENIEEVVKEIQTDPIKEANDKIISEKIPNIDNKVTISDSRLTEILNILYKIQTQINSCQI